MRSLSPGPPQHPKARKAYEISLALSAVSSMLKVTEKKRLYAKQYYNTKNLSNGADSSFAERRKNAEDLISFAEADAHTV